MNHLTKLFFALLIVFGLGCSAPKDDGTEPLSYDPAGATITTDKKIHPQTRQIFDFESAGVTFSNDYDGSRLNDIVLDDEVSFTATIRPENAPVNNSAWYGFKVWSDTEKEIQVTLSYEDGSHRYIPKLSHTGNDWTAIDPGLFHHDTTNGTGVLTLDIGPDTLWVSAQELLLPVHYDQWMAQFDDLSYVTQEVFGESKQGRPLKAMTITETETPEAFVMILSRLHPPEVTGALAVLPFIETLAGDSDLAKRFRKRFSVVAVPLSNPDGVINGHWRHSSAGVDLNRDWVTTSFNQPEPRQISNLFMDRAGEIPVWFGLDFHSTQYDVFYTVKREFETEPAGITDLWLNEIAATFPDYHVNDDPGQINNPVTKSWFYNQFKAAGVTYEAGDEIPRDQITKIAVGAANAMMKVMLDQ